MLLPVIISINAENRLKHKNTFCGKNAGLLICKHIVLRVAAVISKAKHAMGKKM
jgi:hypothetical protein